MDGDMNRKRPSPPLLASPPASSVWAQLPDNRPGPSTSRAFASDFYDMAVRNPRASATRPQSLRASPGVQAQSQTPPFFRGALVRDDGPTWAPLRRSGGERAGAELLLRRLPAATSKGDLQLMLFFAKQLVGIELFPLEDHFHRAALLRFETVDAALEAQNMLDGRANVTNDDKMTADLVFPHFLPSQTRVSTGLGPAGPADYVTSKENGASKPDPFTAAVSRMQQGLGNGFPSRDALSPTTGGGRFFGAVAPHQELAAPDTEAGSHYKNLFNPQSPIGGHLANEMPGRLGKYLINNELGDDDDSELLRDPIAYAENGAPAQRRATAPQIPFGQMANLSLNTTMPSPSSSIPAFMTAMTSPVTKGGNGFMRVGQQQQQQQQPQPQPQQQKQQPQQHYHPVSQPKAQQQQQQQSQQQQQQQRPQHQQAKQDKQQQSQKAQHQQDKQANPGLPYGKPNFPPVNPADQNPPCNTLYVGNLPIDTSEEELKAMFSKQRGYKRLCFRTKQNGPMCFVEFEDISFATKALSDLYGQPLHNSVKGGIRLSFSKNPLGVRSPPNSSQAASQQGNMAAANTLPAATLTNGFSAVSGPPPGLSAPPGLGARSANYAVYDAGSLQNFHSIQGVSNFQPPMQPAKNNTNNQHPDTYFTLSSTSTSGITSPSQSTPFYFNTAKPHTPFA